MTEYFNIYQKILSDMLLEMHDLAINLVDIDAEGIVINNEPIEMGFNFELGSYVFDFRISYIVCLDASEPFNCSLPQLSIQCYNKSTCKWKSLDTFKYNGLIKSLAKVPASRPNTSFETIAQFVFEDLAEQFE